MIAPLTLRNTLYRMLFVLLAALITMFYVLPIDVGGRHWPGPDLILAMAFAWVLRRPDYVPASLVGAVMLATDFIFLRPPGLWAALSVLAVEFLRKREATSRDLNILVEWAMVAGVLMATMLAYRLALTLFMVDKVSLGLTLLHQMSTIAVYPAVVFVSSMAFGITKITPHEAEELRAAAAR